MSDAAAERGTNDADVRSVDMEEAVKRMYGRSLAWFHEIYECTSAPGHTPPIAAATAGWAVLPRPVRVCCAGPCLDHALPAGRPDVSFQIAVETAIWLAYASRTGFPLLLLVMGGDSAEGQFRPVWDAMADAYRRFIRDLLALPPFSGARARVEPTWTRAAEWTAARRALLKGVPVEAYDTLYQPTRTPGLPREDPLAPELCRAYQDNLLAYHPDFLGRLSGRRLTRVQHLESMQQLRAYHVAARVFGLDPDRNAHLSYVPVPATNGRIRMTRAGGDESLPARLGARELERRIEACAALRRYLRAYLPPRTLRPVIRAFAWRFRPVH